MAFASYSSLLVLLLIGCATAQFRFSSSNATCSRFVRWNRLALSTDAVAPSRRFDMAVAVDPRTNNLFVTGGTTDAFAVTSDLFKFNPETITWAESKSNAAPGAISDHSATYFNGSLLIFGGKVSDSELKNSLYIYNIDADTWTNASTTNNPEPRYGHSAAIYNNKLFIFGGRFTNVTQTNELWSLDLATLAWTQHFSTNTPAPRLWHTTVLFDNEWILYGGYNGVSGTSDVWSLDFATLQWTQISSTSPLDPRSGHVAFALEGEMFVVGGEYDDPAGLILNNNDVWSFNPATDEWTQYCSVGTSIHPRLGARGDVATLGGVTGGLIFGGLTTDTAFSAVYAYNDVWAMSVVSTQYQPTSHHSNGATLTLTGVTALATAALLL